MKEPFFSIIVPTFNSAATLHKALESVLAQSFDSFEILVVDGVSKDASLQIVETFEQQDQRIKHNSAPDKGIYDAMNKGIGQATGQWLLFLGSDDQLHDSTVLKNVAEKIAQTDAKVVYGNVRITGDTTWAKDGTIYDGAFDFKKILRQNICHQCIFYNRQFINDHSVRYNIDYRLLADWDFNLRCFAKTDFEYLDLIIADFFGGGQTTATNQDPAFMADFAENILRYFNIPAFSNKINDLPDDLLPSIYTIQKKQSALKYYLHKIKRKVLVR